MNMENIPAAKTKEARREELYEKLEKKKESVSQLIELFSSDEFEGRELVAQAEDIFLKIKADMPEEAVKGLGQLQQIDQELRELYKAEDIYSSKEAGDLSSEEVEAWDNIQKKIEEKIEEGQKLEENDDIKFLYVLDGGMKGLKEKAEVYEAYKMDPKKVALPSGLRGVRKKEEQQSKLSVNIIIDSREYSKKIGSQSSGVHFRGTIFNAIRNIPDRQEMKKTTLHENSHCIYECFNGWSIVDFEKVRKIFDRVIRHIKEKNPKFIIGKNIESFQKIAKYFFHSSQGELVANFDELLEGDMHTELKEYHDIVSNIKKLSNQVSDEKSISRQDKDILLKLVAKFEQDIAVNFRDFYTKLSDYLFVAQQENKVNDLHSLMLLFSPDDYHKIGKYLEHKIGPDKYRMYQIIRRIIKDPYFEDLDMSPRDKMLGLILFREKHVNIVSPLNLRSAGHPFSRKNIGMLMDIKSFDFEISEPLRQAVAAAMEKENFYILGRELGYKTHTQLQEYIQLVKDLAAALKLDIVIKE